MHKSKLKIFTFLFLMSLLSTQVFAKPRCDTAHLDICTRELLQGLIEVNRLNAHWDDGNYLTGNLVVDGQSVSMMGYSASGLWSVKDIHGWKWASTNVFYMGNTGASIQYATESMIDHVASYYMGGTWHTISAPIALPPTATIQHPMLVPVKPSQQAILVPVKPMLVPVKPSQQAMLVPVKPMLVPVKPSQQAMLVPVKPSQQAMLVPVKPTQQAILVPVKPVQQKPNYNRHSTHLNSNRQSTHNVNLPKLHNSQQAILVPVKPMLVPVKPTQQAILVPVKPMLVPVKPTQQAILVPVLAPNMVPQPKTNTAPAKVPVLVPNMVPQPKTNTNAAPIKITQAIPIPTVISHVKGTGNKYSKITVHNTFKKVALNYNHKHKNSVSNKKSVSAQTTNVKQTVSLQVANLHYKDVKKIDASNVNKHLISTVPGNNVEQNHHAILIDHDNRAWRCKVSGLGYRDMKSKGKESIPVGHAETMHFRNSTFTHISNNISINNNCLISVSK